MIRRTKHHLKAKLEQYGHLKLQKNVNIPFFSYKAVLVLRRIVSVLVFAPAVQHSWSFSTYMKALE